jgi:SPP1 gp7 family putative phage head morphogenesis protein
VAEPPITIRGALDLPPEDAERAFRARDELRTTVSWREFEPEEHARAFTVAKVARLDILTDLKTSLDRALAEGRTFEQWRDEIEPTLRAKGWWGLVQDRSLTGTSDPVFIGERRLRTIFNTNMRVSRAAGQWARIQAAKERRPYLRYSAVLDNRTRPSHRAWHGIVRPVDDPIWRVIFPPNGWNCRCTVTQWAERDLERRGWAVTPDDRLPPLPQRGTMPFGPGFGIDRPVIQGIDAGWDYNPGAASLRGLAEKLGRSLEASVAAGNERAARQTLEEIMALPALEQFLGDRDLAMPFAILSAELAVRIDSRRRVVSLTRRTVEHVLVEKARGYSPAVFRAAARGLDAPLLQVAQPGGRLATVFRHEGRLYVLAVRVSRDGRGLRTATIHRTNAGDLARLRRTGDVIVDAMQGDGAR